MICSQLLPSKIRKEEEMRNKIKLLEEQYIRKQQALTSEDRDKMKDLEESLIRATLDKVFV